MSGEVSAEIDNSPVIVSNQLATKRKKADSLRISLKYLFV
jgi:hypothetical protein